MSPWARMLRKRLITAGLGSAALVYLFVYSPSYLVALFLLGIMNVSLFEALMIVIPKFDQIYFELSLRATEPYSQRPKKDLYLMSGLCLGMMSTIYILNIYLAHVALASSLMSGVLITGLLLTILIGVFATRGIESEMGRVLGMLLSLVFAGYPWLLIWELYHRSPGNGAFIMLLLFVVWMGDTGAFFGGKFLGQHQLAPHKSPKKTWEGAACGLAASVAGGICWSYFYPQVIDKVGVLIGLSLIGGIFGQLGDLVESVIKRFTEVKDSGSLLPGHGGLLDRVDGLLFAAPVIWIILVVSGY